MTRKNNRLFWFGFVGAVIASVLIVFLIASGGGINNFGNFAELSLVEDHRSLNCDAFNKLGVTKNGVFTTVASGREGFNPVLDSNLLSITQGGVPIESFHVQLWLICDGDFMKDSSAVTVSGTNNLLLCGDPRNAGTTCLLSDDRNFQSINGVALSTTQFNSFPLGSFALPEDQETLIYQGNMRADDLERIFPSGVGDITFTSRMFPQLTITFNHPELGVFVATHDGLATNDLVYAQFSGLASNVPPPPDTDGDGINDSNDSCINEPEDLNGFEDADGCPDQFRLVDQDNDGVIDELDFCMDTNDVLTVDSIGCSDFQRAEIPVDPVTEPEVIVQTDPMFMDSDNDGVVDSGDLCPTTSAGETVDSDGCTIPEQLEVTQEVPPVEFEDIGTRVATELPPPLVAPQPTTALTSSFSCVRDSNGNLIDFLADEQFCESINPRPSSFGELALSDIIIFTIIGILIAVPIIILIRRRK